MRNRVCKEKSKAYCPFCGNSSLKPVQAIITNKGIVGIGDFIPKNVAKQQKQNQKKTQKKKQKKKKQQEKKDTQPTQQ